MKRLLIILFVLPVFAKAQLGIVSRGDTIFSFDPATNTFVQLTKLVPSQTGQAGKFLSTNGTNYQWLSGDTTYISDFSGKVRSLFTASSGLTYNNGQYYIGTGQVSNTMLANTAVALLSGTNSGDNAANSTYANDYRASNFVAGTNYLAPNGSAASLTSFPTLNQNTTGTAGGLSADIPESRVTNLVSDLAAKQATIVTGNTSQYLKGDLSLGTYSGYSINVQALTSSPTDAQTIYFGMLPKAPVTAAATSKIYIRKAGTIKIAEIYCYSGTAGTNEAWVLNIRLNNTTDTQIASVSASTNERVFSNTNLSIAVNVGDYIEIKSVNPTWATNPLTTIFGGYVYIE